MDFYCNELFNQYKSQQTNDKNIAQKLGIFNFSEIYNVKIRQSLPKKGKFGKFQ
jgi:hypothetical protein